AHEAAPARPAGDRPPAVRAAEAERAASARLAGVAVAEAQDAQPAAATEAARDAAGPREAAVGGPDVAQREAEAARPCPGAAAASALPSAAASACRRDRALPVAPGPRQWGHPRHAMRSLQIASP